MQEWEICLRLVLSCAMGGIIGYERQMRHKSAGLRTNMLVALGSCLIMLLSQSLYDNVEGKTNADPARLAAQVVSDFESSVERFEKKVHDLKISKTISIQTAPQIRLIQNNDKVLIDRVQSAIYNSIPLWKNQMVIALGLTNQKKVLEMQHSVNEMTNDLLKKNAEMLKIGTIETAKENERSIVDIETVRKVNDDLVTTIEETLKIQQEGRAKRRAAEAELVELEGRLKKALESTLDGRSG